MEKERAIVRKWKDTGDFEIMFPDVDEEPGHVLCHSTGGHGVSPHWSVMKTTLPATTEEAEEALASYCAAYGRRREEFRLCKRLQRR